MFNKKYFWLFILFLFIFPTINARSFQINSYDINYTLEQPGIVSVSEKLEYQFFGCYTQMFIQKPRVSISLLFQSLLRRRSLLR